MEQSQKSERIYSGYPDIILNLKTITTNNIINLKITI